MVSVLDSLEFITEQVRQHPQRVLTVIKMSLDNLNFALKDLCSLLILNEELDSL